MFNKGIELPCFASITLLAAEDRRRVLESYFRDFLELAEEVGCGIVLESATWRASPDWAEPLGFSMAELDALNGEAIAMLLALRENFRTRVPSIIISGCIGPRGDGYDPGAIMSLGEAETYHSRQAALLVAAGADMLTAVTMTNIAEAIGVVRAAQALDAQIALSFTVETHGRLATGDTLEAAITAVDAATGDHVAYYMINCAHPTHFASSLDERAAWTRRIGGVRANASRCSHAELDAMATLDMGDPDELALHYRELRRRFPTINVLGGCCGTDLRHVTAIARTCLVQPAA